MCAIHLDLNKGLYLKIVVFSSLEVSVLFQIALKKGKYTLKKSRDSLKNA